MSELSVGEKRLLKLSEELIRAAAEEGFCMTGFLFKMDEEKPFLLHIGTVSETGPALTQVHVMLCDMLEEASERATYRRIKL